jgi:CRISPR-associated protein Cas2
MYCIIVYDISGEAVVKVCHFLRRYMNWIQNSVFEGELTKSQLYEIKTRLKTMINLETDSLLIYTLNSQKELTREQIGTPKRGTDRII